MASAQPQETTHLLAQESPSIQQGAWTTTTTATTTTSTGTPASVVDFSPAGKSSDERGQADPSAYRHLIPDNRVGMVLFHNSLLRKRLVPRLRITLWQALVAVGTLGVVAGLCYYRHTLFHATRTMKYRPLRETAVVCPNTHLTTA